MGHTMWCTKCGAIIREVDTCPSCGAKQSEYREGRPIADWDICECGDYRYQHENGLGKCGMQDDLCHGFKPCLQFRLAAMDAPLNEGISHIAPTRICRFCRGEWPDDFIFCPACGTRIQPKQKHSQTVIFNGKIQQLPIVKAGLEK